MTLDPRPTRRDLTDREVAKILGGMLGGLVHLADLETLRRALRWWADTNEAWDGIRAMVRLYMDEEHDGSAEGRSDV
jgi:hypothetical protein